VEEKIKIEQKPVKSPVLAGILSVIFPGAGALYNGNYLKGIIMMIIFAGLVSIQGAVASHLSACSWLVSIFPDY